MYYIQFIANAIDETGYMINLRWNQEPWLLVLKVLDESKAARYYFDPLAGDVQREISPSKKSPLASLINEIR